MANYDGREDEVGVKILWDLEREDVEDEALAVVRQGIQASRHQELHF